MATLYMMMGAPGSGKSSWVEAHLNPLQATWVSRDAIRFTMVKEEEEYFSKEKEVFAEYVRRINALLEDDYNVIADATHLTAASRNKLISKISAPNVSLCAVWINTPLETCIERNENRKGTRSYVPVDVIQKMYKYFEKPTTEEGFNSIYIKQDGEFPEMVIVKEEV